MYKSSELRLLGIEDDIVAFAIRVGIASDLVGLLVGFEVSCKSAVFNDIRKATNDVGNGCSDGRPSVSSIVFIIY